MNNEWFEIAWVNFTKVSIATLYGFEDEIEEVGAKNKALRAEVERLKALGDGLACALREAIQGFTEMDSPHPTAWGTTLAAWGNKDG